MDTPVTNEKQLLAEIDHLREQFTQTQDLYREVCVLLFFRYGITPTANKLYQLVRKGSMTAPAEALNKFWEDLRKKSCLRIEHPDLPEALKTAAGDLTATLWSTAQALANETLVSYRDEARVAVADANMARESAQAERDASQRQLEAAVRARDEAHQRISALEQNLAALTATNNAIKSQLQQANDGHAASQHRMEDARRDFTAELDKLRTMAQLADERFRAAETRALLEIDRERSAGGKLKKELDATRVATTLATERHRAEITSLQEQLGNLRQKTGVLEGNLQAVTTQASLERAAAEHLRLQVEKFQQIAAKMRTSAKSIKKPQKSDAE